jgi:Zn-dependent peptidase ImmA (M78 family)
MNTTKEWQDRSKRKAEEILREVNDFSPLSLPIPIQEVIESYLGDVQYVTSMNDDFPEGVSAFAKKDMNVGWIVVVNGKESVERQRFSAAHELGHIVLIENQAKKVFCSGESKSWDEKVCDCFAGDILMPETTVRKLYEGKPSPFLNDVAKTFKVSRQVAEIQLKRLGLPFTLVASTRKRVFIDF